MHNSLMAVHAVLNSMYMYAISILLGAVNSITCVCGLFIVGHNNSTCLRSLTACTEIGGAAPFCAVEACDARAGLRDGALGRAAKTDNKFKIIAAASSPCATFGRAMRRRKQCQW